jgi:hypothetical protein
MLNLVASDMVVNLPPVSVLMLCVPSISSCAFFSFEDTMAVTKSPAEIGTSAISRIDAAGAPACCGGGGGGGAAAAAAGASA